MTSDYLSKVAAPRVLLDVTEDDDLTEAFDMQGFEVVGIVTPATLTNADTEFYLQIDPDGSGTFYDVMDEAGTAFVWTNVGAGELLQMDIDRTQPVVGAQGKLRLSAAEGADRTFKVLLRAL